jgi:phage shock protein PspC (stress-responsive transcriptional regulator)
LIAYLVAWIIIPEEPEEHAGIVSAVEH